MVALIFIPFSFVPSKIQNSHKALKKKILILICLSLVIFCQKCYRINNEMNIYNYNPFSQPFYKLDKNHFRVDNNLKN